MLSVLLVVEDAALQASLVALLEGLGYQVSLLTTATGAIATKGIDVVVLDVPSGPAADASKLDQLLAGFTVPVVLLTDNVDAKLLASTRRAAGYALKPPSPRELTSTIELAAFRDSAGKHAAVRERWYRSTLRCIVDGVITTDENARVTFMNPVAEQLTGLTQSEAEGKDLNEVFVVEPGAPDAAADATPVLRLRPRGGQTAVMVEHNSAPIVDDDGGLLGVIVVFRDVTERRRIEQRLAVSDRMASIGTLAAGIAHELNNPLAFVTSNLEFVLQELTTLKAEMEARTIEASWVDGIGDSIDALREARDGASRAASIIKDMKVFARGQSDPALLVDVNRAVGLALRLTSNEIKHRAELLTSLGNVPPVLADEGKLVQVLVNLLTNAVQSLDEKDHHVIRVSTESRANKAVISVTDTGRGIAPEHLDRVFEPFFTTKAVGEGLGLGLSIAHTIITSFAGTIAVTSDVDVGTTLTIALPAAEPTAAAVNGAGPARAAGPAVNGRVLVVDDEALIGTAIRRILLKHGLDIVVETQGKAAFDRLAAGEQFDVVLCDLMMPGFSGADLYDGLDTVAPEMKQRIVFMTGNAFTPRANALFENTGNVRLEKPFVPADLTRVVAEVMRRNGRELRV